MAQLLYFVDGINRLTLEQAHEFGLAYAFPGPQFVCAPFTAAGPGGDTGCLLGVDGERLGYYRDLQTWLKMPAIAGAAKPATIHVGLWNELRPTPAELAVAKQLAGSPIRLRDGNEWLVPVAREWSEGGWSRRLPAVLKLDDAGKWVSGAVDPQYARLWQIAEAFWRALFRAEVTPDHRLTFDLPGATDAAIEVLGANYRLGRAEAALLGLLDDQLDLAAEILRKLVDFDSFLAWQKKSLVPPIPAGSATSAGAAASPRSTAPPSPTSGRSKRSRKAS